MSTVVFVCDCQTLDVRKMKGGSSKVKHATLPSLFWWWNKVDQLDQKEDYLPRLANLSDRMNFAQDCPILHCAIKSLDRLERFSRKLYPKGVGKFYPEDQNYQSQLSVFWPLKLLRRKIHSPTGPRIALWKSRCRWGVCYEESQFTSVRLNFSWT